MCLFIGVGITFRFFPLCTLLVSVLCTCTLYIDVLYTAPYAPVCTCTWSYVCVIKTYVGLVCEAVETGHAGFHHHHGQTEGPERSH